MTVEQKKCGIVSIIGRPNVGKSTLLNQIVGEKVAIVSKVPQTTRQPIRGIYTEERGQIIFIDTPGLHLGKDRLDELMNQTASGALKDMDCIIYLVDTSRDTGEEEKNIVNKLKNIKTPLVLGLNKIDLGGKYVSSHIALLEKTQGKKVTEMENFSMIALSGKKELNLDELLGIVFNYLPVGPALYPEDVVTDAPQKMVIADIIREKLFELMRNELPHSIGVMIESMKPNRKTMNVKAAILVERESQKEIVIGKGGSVLKKVGTLARMELEELLEMKVYLELFVKARKNWRDDRNMLEELGYVSST